MKPLFTIHAGEYLVGQYVETRFVNYNVWLPAKDKGVDILVTNPANRKLSALQVKFSKDFMPLAKKIPQKVLSSFGWWTLNRNKIKNSKADLWVFVLYNFNERDARYLVMKPADLLKRLTAIHGKHEKYHTYFLVTKKNKCWEVRDLPVSEQSKIFNGSYKNSQREFSKYLDAWKHLKSQLG